jgi:hypothetical protein
MAIKLSDSAYEHAKRLIKDGARELDDRDAWSEHQPSAAQENEFIERHSYREYGMWHLGVDDSKRPETKGHYRYPLGDFERIHRCAVLSAEVRAAQNDHEDIRVASAHLHGMLDAFM